MQTLCARLEGDCWTLLLPVQLQSWVELEVAWELYCQRCQFSGNTFKSIIQLTWIESFLTSAQTTHTSLQSTTVVLSKFLSHSQFSMAIETAFSCSNYPTRISFSLCLHASDFTYFLVTSSSTCFMTRLAPVCWKEKGSRESCWTTFHISAESSSMPETHKNGNMLQGA